MSIDPNLMKELNDFLPSSTKEKLLNPSAGVIGQGIAGMLLWVFQKPLKFGIVKNMNLTNYLSVLQKVLVK